MKRSKIIIDLVRDEITVIQAINILKLLLQDCKNEKILNWLNREIDGYSNEDEIPKYRKVSCNVVGNVKSGYLVVSKMNIPVKEEYKKFVMNYDVRCGLNSVYQYSLAEEKEENHHLVLDMPLDYINAASLINGEITHARRELSIYAFTNILNDLKPIVLNIYMELERNYGNLDDYYIDMNDIEKSQQINNYIINILEDNSIRLGDSNTIKNSNIGENNEN